MKAEDESTTAEKEPHPNVIWDGSQMKTTYVNATNVVAGKEEVMMLLPTFPAHLTM